jgi:hypothetical protein
MAEKVKRYGAGGSVYYADVEKPEVEKPKVKVEEKSSPKKKKTQKIGENDEKF